MTVKEHARREILDRYARLHTDGPDAGRPVFCTPSRAEREGRKDKKARGNDGKVIFDSKEKAMEAARAFLLVGANRQYAYPCPRSRHGHHHLSKDQEFARQMQELRKTTKRQPRRRR